MDDMIFKKYTIEEFNNIYNVNTNNKMDIEEFTNYIELNGIDYDYASSCKEDVLKKYKKFLEETGHKCDLICVNNFYLTLL